MSATRSFFPRTPSVRIALPFTIVALAAVVSFGLYLRFVSNAPLPIDEAWRMLVRVEPGSVGFALAAGLAELGSARGVAMFAAIAGALLLSMRERRAAVALLLACVLGVAASESIKLLVARPRPMAAIYETVGSSYPSGHSMGAAVVAISLVYTVSALRRRGRSWATVAMVRWVGVGATTWICLMMWSRTALGVHWLSDTLAGALLGISAAVIAQVACGQPSTNSRTES